MPVFEKCQIFTPSENVKKLLDVVGYNNNLFGRRVAENSCGDGNILLEIVKRYIEDCLSHDMPADQIAVGLNRDVWAAEIDKTHIVNCVKRLNKLATSYEIYDVSWNIFEGDALKKNMKGMFDFVIGNPPYITYKELDEIERDFVRSRFKTCAVGKFDYYYAFIEAGLQSLNNEGKLAYLIPSNIFKNRFAENLREYIAPWLTDIYDYTNQKLFSGKLTSSAIIVCDRNTNNADVVYHNVSEKTCINIRKVDLGSKWIFNNRLLVENNETVRFGDYFHAASSIATLLNKVYIITDYEEYDTFVSVGKYKIEKDLLKTAVSPRSLNYQKDELLLFPYYYTDEGLQKYTVKEFKNKFPLAVKYLNSHKKALNDRKSDKGISWFEYGRSQALLHQNQEKLLVSTLITGEVKVYLLDKEIIPTSGLYIISKNNSQQYTLEQAKTILESPSFLEYAKAIGVISNGNSYRISSKDINEFRFSITLLR